MKKLKVTKLVICALFCMQTVYSQNKNIKRSKYIHPIIESDSVFDVSINSSEFAVVDFWAVWCKPCQMFIPEYEKIAKYYYKKVEFYQLNFDKCQATAQKYNISGIPVIMVFKNSQEVKRYTGLTAKERIIYDIGEMLKEK